MILLLVKLQIAFLPFKFKDNTMDIEIHHVGLLPDLISMAELASRNSIAVRAEMKDCYGSNAWFLTVYPDYTGTVIHMGGATLRFQLIQMATTHHLEVIPS